ncbi:hypothetical protein [Aquincola tertiaricarbonis]|uniref:hypothetical protein n=1 Tax=Aquincola tertiaricarbonis TaxID=391953 RepID=UPI00061500DE|nr:hypothetical protein [Aquincola tertiaricarbonis]
MTPAARQRSDLAQLQRVRALREEAARRLCEVQRLACDAARVAIGRRQQAIHALRRDIAALARHQAGEGAAQAPQLGRIAAAHREMLDDRLERAEYGLIDDEEALEAAEARLAEAQAALRRCRTQTQALDDLQDQLRRDDARLRAQRLEREAEPVRRHPVSGSWV